MKVVIDSSVAVKLVAPEQGQEDAFDLVRGTSERVAPKFLLVEAANTFWKKAKQRELSVSQLGIGMEVVEDAVTRFVDDRDLIGEAIALALELDHPVYDCLYLSLALRENAPLVTADLRFVRKIQPTRLSGFIRPLAAGA